MESPKEAHLLFGVMLHGAARLEAGLELTDLESQLVGPVRRLLSDEEVREFGRVYREEAATRSRLFPDTLATRPVSRGYCVADLVADLPGLGEELESLPNANVIDLDAPGGMDAAKAADSGEFLRAVAAYGYGATVVTASAHSPAPASSTVLQARLTAVSFSCEYESNELSGSDEIYWALGAGSDRGAKTSLVTGVYGDVDAGETHSMNVTMFEGPAEKLMVWHAQCWESDHGQADDDLRRTIEEIAAELRDVAAVMGKLPLGTVWEQTTSYVKLLAILADFVSSIIGWLLDDFVAERTVIYDRAALEVLSSIPGYTMGYTFTGPAGEGKYSLSVNVQTQPVSETYPPIAAMWPALPSDFTTGLDAACLVPKYTDRAFVMLFKGSPTSCTTPGFMRLFTLPVRFSRPFGAWPGPFSPTASIRSALCTTTRMASTSSRAAPTAATTCTTTS
ncbi:MULTISPECIES: hypothetical protein [unclassified Streptomyces]|uniref:hypothetical protein n=1 Tax=unclassified Streptomyces TaxID=2593676 RepID=UPI00093C61F4|nr:hypothetical protein [Streptomyces sp. TSRI0281]